MMLSDRTIATFIIYCTNPILNIDYTYLISTPQKTKLLIWEDTSSVANFYCLGET